MERKINFKVFAGGVIIALTIFSVLTLVWVLTKWTYLLEWSKGKGLITLTLLLALIILTALIALILLAKINFQNNEEQMKGGIK